jgi:hypothetical protein
VTTVEPRVDTPVPRHSLRGDAAPDESGHAHRQCIGEDWESRCITRHVLDCPVDERQSHHEVVAEPVDAVDGAVGLDSA